MQSLQESQHEKIKRLQGEMLKVEQVEVPIQHYFANGFYAREMQVKAGVVIVGKTHKSEHLCIIQKGRVRVVSDEFTGEVTGPYTYVSKPGAKRAMHVLEDLTWTTVHMTTETDLDVLEDLLIEYEPELELTPIQRDQRDHALFLTEIGLTEEQAERFASSATELEYIDLEEYGLEMKESKRHGFGIFATKHFEPTDFLCPMLIGGKRTQPGRYINHSPEPNTVVVAKGYNLVADQYIQPGDEITLDYRQVLSEVQS